MDSLKSPRYEIKENIMDTKGKFQTITTKQNKQKALWQKMLILSSKQ